MSDLRRQAPASRLVASRGQTTVDYLGVVALVAALIAAIVVTGPSLAGAVKSAFEDAICTVTGGSCGGEEGSEQEGVGAAGGGEEVVSQPPAAPESEEGEDGGDETGPLEFGGEVIGGGACEFTAGLVCIGDQDSTAADIGKVAAIANPKGIVQSLGKQGIKTVGKGIVGSGPPKPRPRPKGGDRIPGSGGKRGRPPRSAEKPPAAPFAGGTVVKRWRGPGPVRRDVARSFRGGRYAEVRTTNEVTLYRVYGGASARKGSSWSRTPPNARTRERLALPDGNTAEEVVIMRVPKGQTFYEGTAAKRYGRRGGGNQVYMPRKKIRDQWLVDP